MKRGAQDVVYHFTSTMHLPWIVASAALLPYPDVLPGIGYAPAFIWGTTKRTGDKTASVTRTLDPDVHSGDLYLMLRSANWRRAWKGDRLRLVRFTIPPQYFLTWRETVDMQAWTADQIQELVEFDRKAHGEYDQDLWRCRPDPLRLVDVIGAEARTFAGRWRPIDLDPGRIVRTDYPDCIGYQLSRRKIFMGQREPLGKIIGVQLYTYSPVDFACDYPRRCVAEEDAYADAAQVARWEAEDYEDNNWRGK